MPKVSVLMPVYNTKEEYLRAAIESILAQTFTDFEFLILDDCPENDREAVVKSYNDPRIKYFKNEKNLGISESRNKLMDLAQGEYLAVFDHDDLSLSERLEKEAAYLDAHPEVGVVSSWINNLPKNKISLFPQEDHNIKVALTEHCLISHSASMLRKSVLQKHGIRYNAAYTPAEDYHLWMQLLNKTEFHNLPEVLLQYRRHKSNTSRVQKSKMRLVSEQIRKIIRTTAPELYAEYLQNAEDVRRVRLFGFLPLLKIVSGEKRTKMYLFDLLPFLTVKNTRKLPTGKGANNA